MQRRQFIALIAGGLFAWPLGARAQGPIRIGLLPFGSPSNAYDQSLVDAFRSGLRQAGLIEGREILLDIAWTTGSDADTDKAVAELIRRGAALLVPTGSTASVAAKRQTSTIPLYSSASAIRSPWGWSKTLRTRMATPLVSATSFQS